MADQADLIAAFDDCVTRLNLGESVDDCLRRHARFADALRPMLEAGLLVQRSLYPAHEVVQAQYRAHLRVAQAAASINRTNGAPARRWLGLAASLLIVTLSILTGIGIAAENSLPGDAIYPVKRLTESLRAILPNIDEVNFNTRRLDEVRQLIALRREANVTFDGSIEQIDGENWLVERIPVRVPAELYSGLTAYRGDVVRVVGSTSAEGIVLASSIEVLIQQPTPTPSATLFATNTLPAPAETLVITTTPAATQTTTPTPSATATLMPTSTPIATIVTPTPSCPPTQPVGWIAYTIRAGDTLSELAAVTGTTIETIVTVNCLDERRLIVVGNTLFLPSMPPTPAPVQQIAPTPAPQNPPPSSGGESGGNDNGDDGGNDDGGSGNDDGGGGNDNDDDNSGPGGGDDDDDNSGPGGGDDDDDNSGPGGGDD